MVRGVRRDGVGGEEGEKIDDEEGEDQVRWDGEGEGVGRDGEGGEEGWRGS